MKAPPYKKPQYPASRSFNQLRGAHDGFVDMTQLAIRFLAQQAERSGSPHAFALAVKKAIRGIATTWHDPAAVLSNAARGYIVQSDMIADRFFKALRDDVRKYKAPAAWAEFDGKRKLDSLNQLLANMETARATAIRSSTAFAVANYYRLVRNDIIHDSSERGHSRAAHSELMKKHRESLAEEYPGLNAPNPVDRLCFDDFRVFTRALDRLAPPLNDAMNLTPVDVARVMLVQDATLALIRRRRSDPRKLAKSVRGYCNDRHGMGSDGCSEVLTLIEAFLKVDPNRKGRRREAGG